MLYKLVPVFLTSVALLSACGPAEDPAYTRCVTERKTYCERLFACVQLGGLSVTVNYENENSCETEETKKCETVTSATACSGSTSTYSSKKHDQCIADQKTQSCSAFANRPTSCESYCCTTGDSSC